MKKVQLLKITGGGGGGGLTGHYSYYYRPVGKHERMLENLCQASRHSVEIDNANLSHYKQ